MASLVLHALSKLLVLADRTPYGVSQKIVLVLSETVLVIEIEPR